MTPPPAIFGEQSPHAAQAASPPPKRAGTTNHNGHRQPRRATTDGQFLPWFDDRQPSFRRAAVGGACLEVDQQGLRTVSEALADRVIQSIKARRYDVRRELLDPQRLALQAEQSLLELPAYQDDPYQWLRSFHAPTSGAARREFEALVCELVQEPLNRLFHEARGALRQNPFAAAVFVQELAAHFQQLVFPPVDQTAWPQALHEERLWRQLEQAGPLPSLHESTIEKLLAEGKSASLEQAARAAARTTLNGVLRRGITTFLERLTERSAESRRAAEQFDLWSALAATETPAGSSTPGRIRESIPGPTADQLWPALRATWQVDSDQALTTETVRRLEQRLQATLREAYPDLPAVASLTDLVARAADGRQLFDALTSLLREATAELASPYAALRTFGVSEGARVLDEQATPFNALGGYQFAELGIEPATVAVFEHPPVATAEDQATLDELLSILVARTGRNVNVQLGSQFSLLRVITKFPIVVTSGYTALTEGFCRAVEAGHLPFLDDLLAESADRPLDARFERVLKLLNDRT